MWEEWKRSEEGNVGVLGTGDEFSSEIVMLGIGRSESGTDGISSLGGGGRMREGVGVDFRCSRANTSIDGRSCFGAIGSDSENRGGGFLFG